MSTDNIWTLQKLLQWTQDYFRTKGIDTPRLDAEILLAHLLGRDRMYLYVHFDEVVGEADLAEFREMVKARANRKPVAYILGKKDFMGLTFKVTEATLIPRPDTETLVTYALDKLKHYAKNIKIADIGTGTGAIGLSLLNRLPMATLDTVDMSAAAIEVARENAEALELIDRVNFYEGDLLEPLIALADNRYEAILANPPYIPDMDISALMPEVRDYEPRLALAGGEDGLDLYRRLTAKAPSLLKPKGLLAFEVGVGQAETVADLMSGQKLVAIEIIKDIAGIKRVVAGYQP